MAAADDGAVDGLTTAPRSLEGRRDLGGIDAKVARSRVVQRAGGGGQSRNGEDEAGAEHGVGWCG